MSHGKERVEKRGVKEGRIGESNGDVQKGAGKEMGTP